MDKTLNLYLLTQDENNGYDTYDSLVVAAYSQEEAIQIHPSKAYCDICDGYQRFDVKCNLWDSRSWASSPDKVNCKLVGIATEDIKPNSIVCSSFNAG